MWKPRLATGRCAEWLDAKVDTLCRIAGAAIFLPLSIGEVHALDVVPELGFLLLPLVLALDLFLFMRHSRFTMPVLAASFGPCVFDFLVRTQQGRTLPAQGWV